MKNIRVLVSNMMALIFLALLTLVSCTDSTVAPPQLQESVSISTNSKGNTTANKLASSPSIDENVIQNVDAGITILQTTVNPNNVVTVRFRLLIQSHIDPTEIFVTRVVEQLDQNNNVILTLSSQPVGIYTESGVYSVDSPVVSSGTYRLTFNTSTGGSSARIVVVP
jgi:hypothetical protein